MQKKIEVYDVNGNLLGELSIEDKNVTEIIEKIYSGKFVDSSDEIKLDDFDKMIVFTDENGISVKLLLYKEGYVVLNKLGNNFILKLDEAIAIDEIVSNIQ